MPLSGESLIEKLEYDTSVPRNTQALLDMAFGNSKFINPVLDEKNIDKSSIVKLIITKPGETGKDRVLYKLVLETEHKKYNVAIKTLGIDKEPFFLDTLENVKKISRDNSDIMDYPTGRKYIPEHYAHVNYAFDTAGIEIPKWYLEEKVDRDLGYWLFADEWESAPLLSNKDSIPFENLETFVQKIIEVYCNGLSETIIWAAVDFGSDDIAIRRHFAPIFLDVGLDRVSEIHEEKEVELHEPILKLYAHFVVSEKTSCLEKDQFFEALMKSKLKNRLSEIIFLIERDMDIISNPLSPLGFEKFVKDLLADLEFLSRSVKKYKKLPSNRKFQISI